MLFCLGWSKQAVATWSLNIGYNNPPGSTVGLNALYFGNNFGFEAGIGWLDGKTVDNSDGSTTSVYATGDVNLKYFLTSGNLRPYLQGGLAFGFGAAAGSNSGISAGLGGLFAGGGLLLGSPKFYGYGAYNISRNSNFGQIGIGVGI